jgi:hypothetical protein
MIEIATTTLCANLPRRRTREYSTSTTSGSIIAKSRRRSKELRNELRKIENGEEKGF